jgi:hypothetical protein
MTEALASLRRYLAEGSKIIQKVDPLSGPTQANEFFLAVKGKYTDKLLNFTTSTEARLALGVISQTNNAIWQDESRESFDIPRLQEECSKMVRTWKQNTSKSEKRRGESERSRKNET